MVYAPSTRLVSYAVSVLRGAPALPIDEVLPALRSSLERRRGAVVVAPPGAGKTTRIPLDLLDAPWRGDGRVLVLEPRRIAARAAAQQMARLLGEEPGGRIGYRVRLESRVGARTRVEVVTEGILTRMLQEDPSLDGVAAICFDEFHERHLPSDLGLALALESRAVLREDLRLVVMSATLEAAPVARVLADDAGDAPIIASEGRSHPVETHLRPIREGVPFARGVATAVQRAVSEFDGDALVFLPGIAEIGRVRALLEEEGASGAAVQVLHGSLTLDEQDDVLRPRTSQRRIVLSTSIAESSVTIDAVRIVVDAGLARIPRFDPRSGMTRLETTRVSRASADQRRGRAGRTASGVCVRLWDAATDAALPARTVPEVLDSDLAPLALELACAGVVDPAALRWMDAPSAGAIAQARTLLRSLGALDASHRATPHGRAMAALGIAPRLAHLVLRGSERGRARLACEVAALLAERDVLRREAADEDADVRTRVEALRGRHRGSVDGTRLERVRAEAQALQRALGTGRDAHDDSDALDDVGLLVALAYPDRIAKRRPGAAQRFLLRNGRGARFSPSQPMGDAPFLAIADLDGNPAESRVWLAAPLSANALRLAAEAEIETEHDVSWDDASDALRAVERERLGAIVLRERPLRDVDDATVSAALVHAIRRQGLQSLPWTRSAEELRARLGCAHLHLSARFPSVDDAALLDSLENWLAPHLLGVRRRSELARVDLGAALLSRLEWDARAALDRLVPTHFAVPSGSRIAIDYSDPAQPVLAVKLQELFGALETPTILEGRVALTLHLLSPAGRPVQVTRDLASFWRHGYFDVRRDLKGRYPRHPWPDDPLAAVPTRRVKPRGT